MRMLTLALASLVLTAHAGCGPPSSSWTLPPPPSEEIRGHLGRVAVRSDADLLSDSVLTPAIAGACGAMGCGLGAGVLLGVTLAAGVWGAFNNKPVGFDDVWIHTPLGLAIAFVAMIFVWAAATGVGIGLGAVGGTIWGLAKTPSGDAIERDRQILEKAVAQRRLSERIKEAIVARAARETKASVAAWAPGAPHETILQVSGPRVLLHGPTTFDGPLRLYVEVEVRLLGPDGAVLHSFVLGREAGERPFERWVGSDGSPVADELGHPDAYAERIVDEVFVLVGLEGRRSSRGPRK